MTYCGLFNAIIGKSFRKYVREEKLKRFLKKGGGVMENRISSVGSGSPSEYAGIAAGERLLAINGSRIHDVLDYMYYSYDEDPEFTLEREDGSRYTVTLEKDDGEDAGLEFETYLMDKPRSCANNCIFCFVDQLPKGLRGTLYFKDDDVRLSFLTGSYITLTNMSRREVQRIIDLHISPINVSVHTMNPRLRCEILGNRNAGKGIEIIRQFAKAGITMNCQIVSCPGINDGAELMSTMRKLENMYPSVNSVSVIPVGLTAHREGLPLITPYNEKTARDTVSLVDAFSLKCLKKHGTRIFFCSDEFFLKAGLPIPEEDYYEDYPQLENGVGLIRLLKSEFSDAVNRALEDGRKATGVKFSIATGGAAFGTMSELLQMAKASFPNIDGTVYKILNDFFGHSVDVAGLITGRDLTAQLKGKSLGEKVYITNRMLMTGSDVFLDDMTLKDVSDALGVPVVPTENSGESVLNAMLNA